MQPYDRAFSETHIEESYDTGECMADRIARGRHLLSGLGNRIRHLRITRGMTQEDLSEAARLSAKYIGEVERGEKNPTYLVLIQIAHAMKIHVRDLL